MSEKLPKLKSHKDFAPGMKVLEIDTNEYWEIFEIDEYRIVLKNDDGKFSSMDPETFLDSYASVDFASPSEEKGEREPSYPAVVFEARGTDTIKCSSASTRNSVRNKISKILLN